MKAVGIDLGTTNSLVACVENGRSRVLPVDGDHTTLPPLFGIDPKDGSWWVRLLALRRAPRMRQFISETLDQPNGEAQAVEFTDSRLQQDGAVVRIALKVHTYAYRSVSRDLKGAQGGGEQGARWRGDAGCGHRAGLFDDTQRQATRKPDVSRVLTFFVCSAAHSCSACLWAR